MLFRSGDFFEGLGQRVGQRAQQRGTDGVAVAVPDAVAGMALAQALQHGHQLAWLVQQRHGTADHLHQARALLAHGALEEPGDGPGRP